MGQNAICTGTFGLGCTRRQACGPQRGEHTVGCEFILQKNTPLRTQPERREDNTPDSGCAVCRWRNRRQKCSCCRRNRHLKDCWEEDRA